MVKVTEIGNACHLPDPLHGSAKRCVFGTRQVRANAVVIIRIGPVAAMVLPSISKLQLFRDGRSYRQAQRIMRDTSRKMNIVSINLAAQFGAFLQQAHQRECR